jgi:hypothetical protein
MSAGSPVGFSPLVLVHTDLAALFMTLERALTGLRHVGFAIFTVSPSTVQSTGIEYDRAPGLRKNGDLSRSVLFEAVLLSFYLNQCVHLFIPRIRFFRSVFI